MVFCHESASRSGFSKKAGVRFIRFTFIDATGRKNTVLCSTDTSAIMSKSDRIGKRLLPPIDTLNSNLYLLPRLNWQDLTCTRNLCPVSLFQATKSTESWLARATPQPRCNIDAAARYSATRPAVLLLSLTDPLYD